MTTLDLTATGCAIAPASDLSDVLLLPPSTESATVTAPVSIRRYAGGRDRVVSSPGRTDTITVTFKGMSRSNYHALVELVGASTLVLFRDQRTRRIWGVAAGVSGSELRGPDLLESVTFTITSATVSEIV